MLKTLTVALLAGGMLATAANAATFTNSTDGFVDASSLTRDFLVTAGDFTGSTTVTDVNISIFFAKSNDSALVPETSTPATGTPFFNEIEFVLTAPDGTQVTLISNDEGTELVPGDSTETFVNGTNFFSGIITFDQSAATDVDSGGDIPVAGTFRPDDVLLNNLDIFNGLDAEGTWSLFIEDDVGADGLSFYEAVLEIETTVTTPVPLPAGAPLLLAGLGAFAIFRRKSV